MRGRSYVSRRRRWRRRRRRSSTQHPTHSRFSGRLNAFGVCQAAAPSTPPPPAAQWPHLPPPPLAPLLTKRRAASRLVSSPRRTRRASRARDVGGKRSKRDENERKVSSCSLARARIRGCTRGQPFATLSDWAPSGEVANEAPIRAARGVTSASTILPPSPSVSPPSDP
ncbi:hypothetical protein ALC57_07450 [Trachymyrmex cornetzi]|uniref:Uncharacterized protein n=1 Tax=Trachymyrmex cornetzi TaxID=471704 RepID=A0A195E4P8_9HYME|nr:hypothetical protein ALC57_07450 [Trachymyrmex cornetzi]